MEVAARLDKDGSVFQDPQRVALLGDVARPADHPAARTDDEEALGLVQQRIGIGGSVIVTAHDHLRGGATGKAGPDGGAAVEADDLNPWLLEGGGQRVPIGGGEHPVAVDLQGRVTGAVGREFHRRRPLTGRILALPAPIGSALGIGGQGTQDGGAALAAVQWSQEVFPREPSGLAIGAEVENVAGHNR